MALQGCFISDALVPNLCSTYPRLKCIDLSYTNASLLSLYTILIQCQSLIRLELSQCKQYMELLDLSLKIVSSLMHLNISESPIVNPLLELIINLSPNLSHLNITSCSLLTQDIVSILPLKELNLSWNDWVIDSTLLLLMNQNMNCSKILPLNLSGCVYI